MNLLRKIRRNQAKEAWKKYNERVEKKDRVDFATYWRNWKRRN